MMSILAVGAGGFLGSVFRYLISLIPVSEATVFPIKTFIINIIGCIFGNWCGVAILYRSDKRDR